MKSERPPSDGLLAAGLFSLLLAADLSLSSYFNNFDGVACAMAVETGTLRRLAHGNHVLYGLLGLAFDRGLRLFGYPGPAVLSLGVLNRLLHAACGALMFLLLRRLGAGRRASALGALGLACSYAAWFYALEPQVYLLGLAGLLGASLCLLGEEPLPAAGGLLQALAIGGHATHVLLLPAAAWRLYGQGREKLARYLAALGLGTLAVYALGYWASGIRDFSDFKLWLEGTAAIGLDRSFQWHGGFNPFLWLKGLALAFFVQPGILGLRPEGGAGAWWEAALLSALLAASFHALWPKRRLLAQTLLLWLAAYALFFSTWEPDNPNYHLGDLVPAWIVLTLAFGRLRGALPAAVLVLGLFNLRKGLFPIMAPESNPLLEQMYEIREGTPERAWVATGGDLGMVYVPYFAHRRPLVLREKANHPEVLDLKEPVYVLAKVLEDPRWGPYLKDRFLLAPVTGFSQPLYFLKKK